MNPLAAFKAALAALRLNALRSFLAMLGVIIGVASVRPAWSKLGTTLRLEHTVEYERRTVACTVVKPPFFDPERKRFTPGSGSTTQARASGQAGEAHSHG